MIRHAIEAVATRFGIGHLDGLDDGAVKRLVVYLMSEPETPALPCVRFSVMRAIPVSF